MSGNALLNFLLKTYAHMEDAGTLAPYLVPVILGLLAARIVTARQLAADHVPAGLSLFLLGALGFLILLAVMALVGILIIRRSSILKLIQEKQK